VAKGSTCNYFRPTWKPTFHAMAAKMLQTSSWVPMHLLPLVQCKRWVPIGSMGCVHTHWGKPIIENAEGKVAPEMLWKKMGKIIERLGILVKL
jgi:hypothetical protein